MKTPGLFIMAWMENKSWRFIAIPSSSSSSFRLDGSRSRDEQHTTQGINGGASHCYISIAQASCIRQHMHRHEIPQTHAARLPSHISANPSAESWNERTHMQQSSLELRLEDAILDSKDEIDSITNTKK